MIRRAEDAGTGVPQENKRKRGWFWGRSRVTQYHPR